MVVVSGSGREERNRKEEVGKREWIDRLSSVVIQYRLNNKRQV